MANFFKPAAKTKISNERLTVTITKLDHNGVGVAYWNKKPLFVAGALPTEVVTVKVIENKRKYAVAKLNSIEKKSENRQSIQCQHFGLCGGCDLQMLAIDEQLSFKQQKVTELFSRSFSAENLSKHCSANDLPWLEPIQSEPWQYRRKARIGVQFDKKSQATIGFRQKSTNQLAAIKSCPVLVEPLDNIFPILKKLLAKLTVKVAIGHIEVIQADINQKESQPYSLESGGANKQITLVVRQLKPLNDHDKQLWQSHAEQYHWHVVIDDGKTQKPLLALKSVPVLSYSLADETTIQFASSDFIQVNHQVNNAMINQALSWLNLSADDKVLDLFCGLGNFSLAIAQQVNHVVGVEGVQVMVDKALQNAKLNGLTNCQFFQADLNGAWLIESWAEDTVFDKILLDPARAGAEQAVEQVAQLKAATILYISCDPATLARDSAILISLGYKITKISLIDMFSQTKHVETMVLFQL